MNSARNSASTHNVDSASNSASSLTATLATTSSDSSSTHDVDTNHTIATTQGAMTIASATGENIVVDGSSLTMTKNYSVTLAGSAEQNATGINLVNAAGSMVSNGVNVARTTNMNSTPTLNQVNSVTQRH